MLKTIVIIIPVRINGYNDANSEARTVVVYVSAWIHMMILTAHAIDIPNIYQRT